MFSGDTPTVCILCSACTCYATYGFGDASGAGFGCAFSTPEKLALFCFGTWGPDKECATSNYRELWNLTKFVKLGV
jgi:hypothetical protein